MINIINLSPNHCNSILITYKHNVCVFTILCVRLAELFALNGNFKCISDWIEICWTAPSRLYNPNKRGLDRVNGRWRDRVTERERIAVWEMREGTKRQHGVRKSHQRKCDRENRLARWESRGWQERVWMKNKDERLSGSLNAHLQTCREENVVSGHAMKGTRVSELPIKRNWRHEGIRRSS